MRTRAGAVGEKASIDITASVRIYESSAVHCILIAVRRGGMDCWSVVAGARVVVVVVVIRSRFLMVGIGARCVGLRAAMNCSTFGV